MNQYIPHHQPSIDKALELVKDIPETDQLARFKAITAFADRFFVYDYIRAIEIPKRGAYPDVDQCWTKRMGICMDIAAMVTGMLRAVGIKAWMCYGHVDGKVVNGRVTRQYHAWVEASIRGMRHIYDHKGHARSKMTAFKVEKRF